jgi:hypothetical protein
MILRHARTTAGAFLTVYFCYVLDLDGAHRTSSDAYAARDALFRVNNGDQLRRSSPRFQRLNAGTDSFLLLRYRQRLRAQGVEFPAWHHRSAGCCRVTPAPVVLRWQYSGTQSPRVSLGPGLDTPRPRASGYFSAALLSNVSMRFLISLRASSRYSAWPLSTSASCSRVGAGPKGIAPPTAG